MTTNLLQIEGLTRAEFLDLLNDSLDRALAKKADNQNKSTRLSIQELAEQNPICEQTIRNWIKSGRLKAHKLGRRIFIEEADFQAALSEVKSANYKR